MRSRYTTIFVACLMALPSAPARADFSPIEPTALERFTQSLRAVYTAAEMCKDVPNLYSENYVTLIKAYLKLYFRDDVPYWALPPVTKIVRNRESCMYFIQQDIARYQEDSRQYAENYPNNPTPPSLNYSMMLDGTAININTGNAPSSKEHYLTPKELLR